MSKNQLIRYVSTIGVDASLNHQSYHVRVNFSEYADGTVVVQAVHARSLNSLRGIPQITISKDDFYDLLEHEQDDAYFVREALGLFGFVL